jgi:dTDP-glucose 4,6-dehydratase
MTTHTLLITGGAGFIGSSLVEAATARGHKVIVLDALTYAGHAQNLADIRGNVTLIEGDICDRATLDACFSAHAITGVIHAAAESHVDNSIAGSAAFIRTNIQGTHTLLEAVRAHYEPLTHPVKQQFRLVHISTDEVYGALGSQGSFTQDSPQLPNSPYAASKAAADHLVRAWGQTYGLPVLTTRCCNNYGPRQHPEKLIPRMITNAIDGEALPIYGDGQQIREWIHVADHAAAVFAAYEHAPIGSVTHIGSGAECSNLSLVTQLCDLLQSHGLDAHKQITHVTDRPGHDFRYALSLADNPIALPAVRDMASGLRETVAWYLRNPKWIATMHAHTQQWRAAA